MPCRFLMSDLRLRCQRRVDKENDLQIGTSEWNALISEQYGELWSIVADSGMRYFETLLSITTTGALSYNEPVDHYETVGMCQVVNAAGNRRDLEEFMEQQRSQWSGMTGDARGYSMIDDQIYLYPTPPSGQTYEMIYVPQATDLSSYADGSAVDVVTQDGLKFLIWGVAVMALAKSESDVQLALSEREAARDRFTEDTILRSLNSPRKRQTRILEDNSGQGWGIGGWDPGDVWWGR